jgi:hypothetical protein
LTATKGSSIWCRRGCYDHSLVVILLQPLIPGVSGSSEDTEMRREHWMYLALRVGVPLIALLAAWVVIQVHLCGEQPLHSEMSESRDSPRPSATLRDSSGNEHRP